MRPSTDEGYSAHVCVPTPWSCRFHPSKLLFQSGRDPVERRWWSCRRICGFWSGQTSCKTPPYDWNRYVEACSWRSAKILHLLVTVCLRACAEAGFRLLLWWASGLRSVRPADGYPDASPGILSWQIYFLSLKCRLPAANQLLWWAWESLPFSWVFHNKWKYKWYNVWYHK